ncbi:MAG TPA: PQQ-binding-like beta-propeller repeat protein, partial [Gaiellaceae bacterium]|nr:PQQ-binding-like beta-propeller repeat protein [Gaiellaceae bacterium]
MRLLALSFLALALLAAGCSSDRKAQPTTTHAAPAALTPPPKPAPPPKRSKVHVIVFDGDTGAPVRNAAVHVGRFGGKTNYHGVAKIRIARHTRLQVKVAKRGYDGFRQRLQFRNRPKVGVRVYRADLQWTRYGASPGRTQTHPLIHIRPPFRVVWSRAVGGLMEFPAVVDSDVAFVANYHASVRAYSMRNGKPVWRRDLGGIMAASPAVVGEDVVVHAMNGHVYVLD